MIEEVMYGETPSIIIERFESPPPEKIFKSPKKSLPEINCSKRKVSIPGIGMVAIKRKATNIKRVNKILFLRILSPVINLSL